MDTGESSEKAAEPLRRECRCFDFICGDYTRVLSTLAHEAAGAAKHPAFPAPSFCRGQTFRSLGCVSVARPRAFVSASLRAKRSNPELGEDSGLLRRFAPR